MPDVTSATVTFLFTDIEGSTRLWEQSPAEMKAALARHDALLRTAIADNDGSVFATGGDAFSAAFPTAAAALAAARAAQRALAAEPWPEPARIKVRMALHTGAAEVRNNDYFGPPLNRVARLLAAGHGGQVLLSLATQELVRDGLPVGVALRDLGERRLKDLIRPERVYQMVVPDLPAEFPPLKTLDARAHNLPIQLTSFVGREREMQELKVLLSSSRLVTLTGSGGAGKTRLALQVGADRIDDFADGVWLVELAPLTDAQLVPQAVATVVGVKEQPGVPLTDTLLKETRDKELLLLLDNCEHLVEASARLCQALLASCANVRVLATSREALRIPGEVTYRVPSLATPDPKALPSIASLTQYAAVQLFIDRALMVQPAFAVNNANAPALASICHRLDGIPLAIELAAARVRSLPVEDINRRLDQRFRLLTGGARTALPRQQTLRALIDWSYDLLVESEQALFCRLAVFAGGWAIEAAEQVCSGDPVEDIAVLDLLTSLADKNLVVVEPDGTSVRYRLLETVRQYARDRLRDKGVEMRWQERHLAYLVALAEAAEPHLRDANQQAWLDRLEIEHDNLRAALAWAAAAGSNAPNGLALAGSVWWLWYVRGYLGEGRSWLARMLEAASSDGLTSAARAKALNGAGVLAYRQGDYRVAQAHHEEALAIFRGRGDRAGMANALNNLGSDFYYQGDYPRARTTYEESLAIRRELGDPWGTAAALANLRNIASRQGDYGKARALVEESLAIFRELDDRRAIAMSLGNLGNVLREQGDFSGARARYEEALVILRELGDRQNMAHSLDNLGCVAQDQGDYAAARVLHEESLQISRELGDRQGTAFSLNALGDAALDLGEHALARMYYEQSLATRRELGDRHGIVESMEGLASTALAIAEVDLAVTVWGGAERLREDIGAPLAPKDRPHHDRQLAAARAALGDDAAFDLSWQEGRAMSLERAIDYALGKHGA